MCIPYLLKIESKTATRKAPNCKSRSSSSVVITYCVCSFVRLQTIKTPRLTGKIVQLYFFLLLLQNAFLSFWALARCMTQSRHRRWSWIVIHYLKHSWSSVQNQKIVKNDKNTSWTLILAHKNSLWSWLTFWVQVSQVIKIDSPDWSWHQNFTRFSDFWKFSNFQTVSIMSKIVLPLRLFVQKKPKDTFEFFKFQEINKQCFR